MNRLISIFFTFFIGGCSMLCLGQNQLIGEWTNTYGSVLKISFQQQGILEGVYASSTGSTGKYKVVGTYTPIDTGKNLSVALTILWNSIDGSTKDPSQFWTSLMVGTYYNSTHVMELINLIAAAEEFKKVNILEPNIYPESLTFKRKHTNNSSAHCFIPQHYPKRYGLKKINYTTYAGNRQVHGKKNVLTSSIYSESFAFKQKYISHSSTRRFMPQHYHYPKRHGLRKINYTAYVDNRRVHDKNNPLNDTWVNQEEKSIYSNITINVKEDNTLVATISRDGVSIASIGLAATPGKNFQALAIASSSLPTDKNKLIGITGLLNRTKDKLKVVIATSGNVAYKNKYASTAMDVFYFSRQSP